MVTHTALMLSLMASWCASSTTASTGQPSDSTSASTSQPSDEELHRIAIERANLMYGVYGKRTPFDDKLKVYLAETSCAPPRIANELIRQPAYVHYAKQVKVYYNKNDELQEVRKLVREREPTNIEMERPYDEKLLQQYFDYGIGAYAESNSSKLMANIGIFTQTPLLIEGKELIDKVNVMNLIGHGFDVPKQPDAQYFLNEEGTSLREDKAEELYKRIEMMYRYAFEAAKKEGLAKIQFTGIGEGVFAGEHMAPKIKEFRGMAIQKLEKEYPTVQMVTTSNKTGKPFFNMPDDFHMDDGSINPAVKDTLFLNAWDPWSMVGNGNEADDSLDGKWGRRTAMAWLAWPCTNPWMQYVAIPPQ